MRSQRDWQTGYVKVVDKTWLNPVQVPFWRPSGKGALMAAKIPGDFFNLQAHRLQHKSNISGLAAAKLKNN